MSHPPRLAAVWTRASARAAIEAVLARQPFEGRLTYFGVAKANDPNFAEQREAMFADGAHDEFIDVVNFLQHAPPSRAINTAISSYSWKHALQRHLRGFGGYGGYVYKTACSSAAHCIGDSRPNSAAQRVRTASSTSPKNRCSRCRRMGSGRRRRFMRRRIGDAGLDDAAITTLTPHAGRRRQR